jgi:hypothetical protein
MRITVTEVLEEGNWTAAPWSPRLANDSEFQDMVLTLAHRAADRVAWRVGATHYADTSEPKNSVLKEAEMHLCQAYLLDAAALVADGAGISANPPVFTSGAELRAQARYRRELAEPLITPYDQRLGRTVQRPVGRTSSTSPRVSDHPFDEVTGRE